MTYSASIPSSAPLTELAHAVVAIEAQMSRRGWDAPVAIFALVDTRKALDADPEFKNLVDANTVTHAEHKHNSLTLTCIEQEALPPATDLEALLAHLAWPQTVDGAVISVERITLPARAEQEALNIKNLRARESFLSTHPQRDDIRITVGVLRSGESWCAIRARKQDDDAKVAQGTNLVPALIQSLKNTFKY